MLTDPRKEFVLLGRNAKSVHTKPPQVSKSKLEMLISQHLNTVEADEVLGIHSLQVVLPNTDLGPLGRSARSAPSAHTGRSAFSTRCRPIGSEPHLRLATVSESPKSCPHFRTEYPF